jgi:hypothetical protein
MFAFRSRYRANPRRFADARVGRGNRASQSLDHDASPA